MRRMWVVTAVVLAMGMGSAWARKRKPRRRPVKKAAVNKAGPFAQGNSRISVGGGTAQAFDNTYFVIGGGYAYYLIDGLEVGAEADFWMGATPSITKISPQVRFVFYTVPTIKPYVGGFYRRFMVSDDEVTVGGVTYKIDDDVASLGARAGIFYVANKRTFFSAGLVYEVQQDCRDEDLPEGDACARTYPELGFSLTF